MRMRILTSTMLVVVACLTSVQAAAQDPGAATGSAAGPAKPPPAKAAAPAKPKPAKAVAAKPAPNAKQVAKDKAAIGKKKTRAPGPPHAPDAAARNAVAGPSGSDERKPAESPEMSALRDADRELFGAKPRAEASRSADLIAPPVADPDRPQVFASGLPPPSSAAPSVGETMVKPPDWVSALSPSDLQIRLSARVVRYLEFYRSDPRGKALAAAWMRRSGAYETSIRKVLRANNLPEDLMWVALVESGNNPMAYSAAGAAGLWQFTAPTGKLYGLVVDRWIDERLDPERSTVAAARFLSDLRQRFGNWELALAAYNMGFGGLLTAVRKYNSNDYWELCRFEAGLPWETTLYVPKIAALAIVGRNPTAFGLEGVVRDTPVAFDTVEVAPATSLSSIASAGETDVDKLEMLNPQLMLSRLPPQPPSSSGLWTVRVPAGSAAKVSRNLVTIRAKEAAVDRYTVRAGDTLADIAKDHATTARQLAEINGLDADDTPKAGTVLVIPRKSGSNKGETDRPVVSIPADLQAPAGYRRLYYRVIAGDSISGVAEALGVSVDDLRRWNLLDPGARLQDGMWLLAIVAQSRETPKVPTRTDGEVKLLIVGSDDFFDHHEALRDRVRTVVAVRPNETWNQLASRTGMTVGQLERINRKSRSTKLVAGDRMIAYVPTKMAGGVRAPAQQAKQVQEGKSEAAPKPDDLPELREVEAQPQP